MARNPPTSEMYFKLVKSAKYFYHKMPLRVAERFDGNMLCTIADEYECLVKQKCCVSVDLANTTSRLWLKNGVRLSTAVALSSVLVRKLYKCENSFLNIVSTTLTLNEFKILGTVFDKYELVCVQINGNDGSAVTIDSMLEAVTNLKEFDYWFDRSIPAATASTMADILKLQNLGNLRIFSLHDAPEVIKTDDLSAFITTYKNTKTWLRFDINISPEYKEKVKKVIDDVIEMENRKCFIYYRGQEQEKYSIMERRFYGQE